MSSPLPVTQRDVAQACGLHASTVCLALKNSPSIPLKTRLRIQTIAAELGYHPNVAARNLALLRTEKKPATGTLPLAWINQEPRRDHWRVDAEARVYFEGARRRAEDLGYHLEEIWTQEPGMNVSRVVQILHARGINGVLFPAHRSFDFSLLCSGWNEFAMVGFNDHRLGEWVDIVCPDYYKNTDIALRRLRHLGFERLGLVLTPQFDAASNGLTHSCFLRHQSEIAPGDRVPVCCLSDSQAGIADAFGEWLREHRPDAVLCREGALIPWAHAAGHEPSWVQLHGLVGDFDGGIDAAAPEVAAMAVECVVEKMRRFELGPREATRLHIVKGVWQEGRLMRREAETVVA